MVPLDPKYTENAEFLLGLLAAWLKREAGAAVQYQELDAEVLRSFIQQNRLEPLFYLLAPSDLPSAFAGLMDECASSYKLMAIYAEKHLAKGMELIEKLENSGIPVINMRGPFTGTEFYGDPALRYFTDLDLLVPREDRRRSLQKAMECGFLCRHKGMPIGFFERNHLHYALSCKETRSLVDLHWDADHPFSLLRINFGDIFDKRTIFSDGRRTWGRPCPEHLLILTCLHLEKHLKGRLDVDNQEHFIRIALENGCLLAFLDVALMLRKEEKRLDWRTVEEAAEVWMARKPLISVLNGVEILFGLKLACDLLIKSPVKTTSNIQAPASSDSSPSLFKAWASHTGGFRSETISDAVPYLFPGAVYFDLETSPWPVSLRRVSHFVKASGRLVLAGLDALVCTGIRFFRNRFGGAA